MRTGMAIGAAGLAALAAVASSTGVGGGFWLFFTGLAVAGLVVAACVTRRGRGDVELARAVALAWDGVAAWAAILLAWSMTLAVSSLSSSSPPPGPPELFLGIPVTAFHVAAMWGGALLVTLAAFRTPRTSRLVATWVDR